MTQPQPLLLPLPEPLATVASTRPRTDTPAPGLAQVRPRASQAPAGGRGAGQTLGRRLRSAAWGLGLGLLLAGCAPDLPPVSTPPVSLEAARAEHTAGRAVLIDIREPEEHARGVAPGAQLLPLSQVARRMAEIPSDPDTPVLLICNTQNRSRALLAELEQRGYRQVRYVEGGMSAWVERGWPVVAPGP